MPATRKAASPSAAGLTRDDVIRIVYGHPRSPIQRFTQDSPVLADVWIAYAERPGDPQDLLLTPFQSTLALPSADSRTTERTLSTPGKLAQQLRTRLAAERKTARWRKWAGARDSALDIAYNQSTVAARVWFDELVRVVLPMSHWYTARISSVAPAGAPARPRSVKAPYDLIKGVATTEGRDALAAWLAKPETAPAHVPPDVLWAAQVIGIIACEHERGLSKQRAALGLPPDRKHDERPSQYKARLLYYRKVADGLARTIAGMSQEPSDSEIYLVSLNRRVETTVFRSTVAVKADAAARLFNVTCKDFTWAVIDSGIDATHPAFRRYQAPSREQPERRPYPQAFERKDGSVRNNTRVVGTFDFTVIRKLLSMPADVKGTRPPGRKKPAAGGDAAARKQLAESLNNGREIDWSLLLDLLKCEPDLPPANAHGTHVAGILGADWQFEDDAEQTPLELPMKGMCPDINLYDLRVLGPDGGDEFSVMAALQFVRFLNLHRDVMAVHGVNLSLSIQHDVLNYACGRTPVCEECTRLIGAGVVVVAAAGNEGYQTMPGAVGATSRNVYQAISITDPGNAEAVITVGSTHRDSPHTFGVSYFSSRGPTGDGRSKPDLVAPGEKIESSVPGDTLKRMDGTSMAAPHVSGAAALLMARHRELVGSPQRIKEILCRTATDLGREKYFQGSGMIDVLRALQSV
jgi:subtilisin family serine protease